MSDNEITARLEYLRGEIRAQRISYGELAELQSLAGHIEAGDTELLEWAGVPEFPPRTLADELAHLDRVRADNTNIADWVQLGRERAALLKLAEAVRAHLADPPVIACKCCTDNECECAGRKTGPVTRTGEIQVQS